MSSLRSNLVKRVDRLPKPTNAASAMQPLFEAISNAVHSAQAKFSTKTDVLGKVDVFINIDRAKSNFYATISDNGVGLDDENWDAFVTTDTDHKISIGGKGVGRLLWLDCFDKISINSTFRKETFLKQRSFEFVLDNNNQIQNEIVHDAPVGSDTSFSVKFTGLRRNGYHQKFPGRSSYIFQHLASHFLPLFIGNQCPVISVSAGGEIRTFPEEIKTVVFRRNDISIERDDTFGDFYLTLLECDKVASADMKGLNFIHFIAHGRTVHSHCIDGLLGLKNFGEDGRRVFHGILTGEYLDKNVNQERTAFTFEDAIIERIIREACEIEIKKFLIEPLVVVDQKQKATIGLIIDTYPSVAFGEMDELQRKVPSGELSDDAIYSHLARERFRRDQRQAEKIRAVLSRLKDSDADIEKFSSLIEEAGKAIEETEQRSLAEYVVRRKVVLDFIELLLEKVKDTSDDASYQREDILHSFICPMRISTITDAKRKVEPSSHDLWIIDERLTFAQYFSSDVDFATLTKKKLESTERPDVLIFDYVHGLKQKDESSKILLIEFKRPGRKDYKDDENPQHQIERYVRQLQTGKLDDVKGRPIKLSDKTIFYCFIVADIVGRLDDWTFSWQRTVDGRGRLYQPKDGFRGSIELIGWDALLDDARARNQAFFDKAGISGRSFFEPN